MVNFKIYDVTTWLTNNCNTHIAQYLTKERQSDNEIWSVNRTSREIFRFKNHIENEAERPVPELILFLKKALYEVKASGLQVSFDIF